MRVMGKAAKRPFEFVRFGNERETKRHFSNVLNCFLKAQQPSLSGLRRGVLNASGRIRDVALCRADDQNFKSHALP